MEKISDLILKFQQATGLDRDKLFEQIIKKSEPLFLKLVKKQPPRWHEEIYILCMEKTWKQAKLFNPAIANWSTFLTLGCMQDIKTWVKSQDRYQKSLCIYKRKKELQTPDINIEPDLKPIRDLISWGKQNKLFTKLELFMLDNWNKTNQELSVLYNKNEHYYGNIRSQIRCKLKKWVEDGNC